MQNRKSKMENKAVTISTQLAIFIDSPIARPDLLFNSLNSEIGEVIDAMPQTLPLPADAPSDIPRVIGTSSFGKFNLNISLNRIDFVENYAPTEAIEKSIVEFKLKCNTLITTISQKYGIVRIGLVGNYYVPHKNPSQLITDLYLNKNKSNLDEITIRINKRDTFKNIQINNVINLSQGQVTAQDYNGNAVIVQLDYNSADNSTPLEEGVILALFKEKSIAYSSKHVEEISGL